METKITAYQMHKEGKSYKEIASKLGIGKTTAYDYVKEMKLANELKEIPSIIPVRNGSELLPNVRSERTFGKLTEQSKMVARTITEGLKLHVPNAITPNVPNDKEIEEFSGNELMAMEFDTLEFTGGFLELIGKPEKRFSGIIWGLPKGGKSNFSLRFADYLHEYFGNTLYVAAEEGKSVSMQDKIKTIGGSDIKLIHSRDREKIRKHIKKSNADFVFVDSINVAGIDDAFLEEIKQENPTKSFLAIVQATKGGNFKGDQSLEHNCDFVIKVIKGIAYHKGRFGAESEISIFEAPLYTKNKHKGKKQETKAIPIPTAQLGQLTISNNTVIPKGLHIPESLKQTINTDAWKDFKIEDFTPIEIEHDSINDDLARLGWDAFLKARLDKFKQQTIKNNLANQSKLPLGFTENQIMEFVKDMSIGEAIVKLLALGFAIGCIRYLFSDTKQPTQQQITLDTIPLKIA